MRSMLATIPPALTVTLWAAVVFAILVTVRAVWDTFHAVKGLAGSAKEASTRLREATAILEEEQRKVSARAEGRVPRLSSEKS